MTLIINGESRELEDSLKNVSDLLAVLDLAGKPVVVELNLEPVLPDQHNTTSIKDGDSIEIVRIAAGG